MKATRILLFLSPLLWFMPPLVDVSSNTGLGLLDYFYKGLLGSFPGNALMAFLCYTYAGQLGRESWPWVVGSLRFPFLAPLILGFMPAKYGSAADEQRRAGGRKAPAKAATGAFETRFPLLSAYLANLDPAIRVKPRERMEAVKANFEFSACVDAEQFDALLAGAAERAFTVWAHAEDPGTRIFGAGLVETKDLEGFTAWLRQAAPSRKLATALHPAEGPTKFFEYYPSAD